MDYVVIDASSGKSSEELAGLKTITQVVKPVLPAPIG